MEKKPPRKKRVSVVPENESREDKFRRLGKARLNKAMKALDGIENLAGANYSFTDEQAAIVCNTLSKKVNQIIDTFSKPKKATKDGYNIEL